MTSSASCSTSWRALLCAAVVGCACGHAGRPPARLDERARIAVFPVASLAGSVASPPTLRDSLAATLRDRGLDVVPEDEVLAFLARNRVRDTSGIDARIARGVRDELGAAGVVIAAVDAYAPAPAPSFGMTVRLVTAEDDPAILWMDGWVRAGDESPGLFGIGIVRDVAVLERAALRDLAASLAAFLRNGRAPEPCRGGGRVAPIVRFRRALRETEDLPRVAVLPFHNESARRDAGEIVGLDLVKHLIAAREFRVLEPGVIRSELLRNRVVMEGGVTHEAARTALGAQNVDVVLGGTVYAFGDQVEFTVLAIETWENRVVWESRSFSRRAPRISLFQSGMSVPTVAVACRMVRGVVDGMAQAWKRAGARADRRHAKRSDSDESAHTIGNAMMCATLASPRRASSPHGTK
jgi:TolB-like protein